MSNVYRLRPSSASRVLGPYKMTFDPCSPVPIQQRPLSTDQSHATRDSPEVAANDVGDGATSSDVSSSTGGGSNNSMDSALDHKLRHLRRYQQTRRLFVRKTGSARKLQGDPSYYAWPEHGSLELWSPVQQPRSTELNVPDGAGSTSACDAGARRTITWQKVGPTVNAKGERVEVCTFQLVLVSALWGWPGPNNVAKSYR